MSHFSLLMFFIHTMFIERNDFADIKYVAVIQVPIVWVHIGFPCGNCGSVSVDMDQDGKC